MDIFILDYPVSPLIPTLWETARYRLKYCLKGPLNSKQPNQPPPPLFVPFPQYSKPCFAPPPPPRRPYSKSFYAYMLNKALYCIYFIVLHLLIATIVTVDGEENEGTDQTAVISLCCGLKSPFFIQIFMQTAVKGRAQQMNIPSSYNQSSVPCVFIKVYGFTSMFFYYFYSGKLLFLLFIYFPEQ